MSDPRKYIDDEFERMRQMAIKGKRDEGLEVTLKLTFIAGMSAALGFDGDDEALFRALKPAMKAISAKYGGRTIFSISPQTVINDANSEGKQGEVSEGLASDQ